MDAKRAIAELERKVGELNELGQREGLALSEEIGCLQARLRDLRRSLLPAQATPEWETVKLARQPQRPYPLDYLSRIMEDIYELHGDRLYGDDQAVVAGLGRFAGQTVVFVGTQRGRSLEENKRRNFGMPHPEGYRKALRVMQLAARFGFPIFSLIDTPGAYPGIGAEERNIGGALAESIYRMFQLPVPIIVAIIGEGGSGGALGLAVGDRILMLEHAVYSVITPEGCAGIIWRDRTKAPEAAKALKLTAPHLLELGVIDQIIPEPPGGAHHDPDAAARALKEALDRQLQELLKLDQAELLARRGEKFQRMGCYEELTIAVGQSKEG
ncbi:MAG TPA: acetyl-CoA carboxylase carboxyltransferase subunit alpha [Candidatus Fraserbacteria bacterium]|nr:acetyl-CoA carboxylase carboxyltransferase subunit alpha [Candidatus Fraserbacteria bacterium]